MKKILFTAIILGMLVQSAWCATNDFSKYIKTNFDRYDNVTTYTVKSFNLDTIQPLIFKDAEGKLTYTVNFNVTYYNSEWLYINTISIYSDGASVKYEPKTLQRKVFACSASTRKCTFYEGSYINFNKEDFSNFIKFVTGSDVTIKATGSAGSVELAVSHKNKTKLLHFLEFAKTLEANEGIK